MAWPHARRLAAAAAAPLSPDDVPIGDAVGRRLVSDVRARADLPGTDVSAMDGWAVRGAAPWTVIGAAARLEPGSCTWVRTGGAVPTGADGVLPVECSEQLTGDASAARVVHPVLGQDLTPGAHVRAAGEEVRRGDLLLTAGSLLTPPMVGLAAAAGLDTVPVAAAAHVEVLVIGDELVREGIPERGRARDALGPQLPAWLAAYGSRPGPVMPLPDDLGRVTVALTRSSADVVVTTGGTSVGDRDHVRAAVAAAGGRLVVDGVAVKPGHPMLLAELPPATAGRRRWLVGLPGNPLAACVAVVTLVEPLLAGLQGQRVPAEETVLAAAAPARPGDRHRLVPVRLGADGTAHEVPACGPAMLRGLAAAGGFAVIGCDGAQAGARVEYLPLPWSRPDTAGRAPALTEEEL